MSSWSPLMVIVGFAAIRHRQAVDRGRDRPARGGRVLRPDPVGPVALGLARCHPRRHRRGAGRRHRRRPHRRGPTTAGCPRPPGDARQRTAGRGRFDDAPADRRPRGCRRTRRRTRTTRTGGDPAGRPGRAARPDGGGVRGRLDDFDGARRGGYPRAAATSRRPSRAGCPGERQRIADRIAARARGTYGLTDTLAAPADLRRDRHRGDRPVASHRGRLVRRRPAGSSTARQPRRPRPCRAPIRSGRPRPRPRPTP